MCPSQKSVCTHLGWPKGRVYCLVIRVVLTYKWFLPYMNK
jgi:hypothetical protein